MSVLKNNPLPLYWILLDPFTLYSTSLFLYVKCKMLLHLFEFMAFLAFLFASWIDMEIVTHLCSTAAKSCNWTAGGNQRKGGRTCPTQPKSQLSSYVQLVCFFTRFFFGY
ncbi:hypothetical protein GOP47_0030457 [Adiantum capillus-veneris]|nr:hypothetical protein GOP47_0030457 [Adiantum capillus-veneris]